MLGAALLLAALFGLEARHLRLEADIDLLSADDPVAREDSRRIEIFGPDDRLVVALYRSRADGGVLRRPSLEALRALHDALESLPGIDTVSSLANAPVLTVPPPPDPGVFGASMVPTFEPDIVGEPVLVDAVLDDPRALLHRLRTSEAQRVMLLSLRESLTPLFLELSGEVPEAELTGAVLDLARGIERRHPSAGTVLVVGPAIVENRLAGHVFDDLAALVPFSVALVACGLLLAFRRGAFLAAVLLHTLALEALVLGGMAALGWTVNLVSVLAPVILVPVGVADLLHLFVRLRAAEGTPATGAPGLLVEAFAALQMPMMATTATTALGFLGFLLSPVAAIRQFGITLSIGAVVALLLTFTLDAAVLALVWRPRRRSAGRPVALLGERWLRGLSRPEALRRRGRLALGLAVLLAAVAATALLRVRIEDTWIRNFDPDSRVLQDTRLFEYEHFGTNVLSLVYEADPTVSGSRARALNAVNRFTTAHTVALGLRGLVSPTLLVRALDPHQGLPWTPWPTPTVERMADGVAAWRARGMALPDIGRFVDGDLRHFQVQLYVVNQPYAELVEVLERVIGQARHTAGPGVRVDVSGNLAVNIRMVREVVLGQARSLLVLLATVTVLLMFLARSLSAGLVLALPMALAIGHSYFALVQLELPYGIAVSMFPTLVVGLSVDFAIHLRAVLQRRRHAPSAGWARDVAVVLRGIVLNGILWSAGFALLAASSLPPNRYLGLLCGLVVALSTIFTVALLPAFASPLRREPPSAEQPRQASGDLKPGSAL